MPKQTFLNLPEEKRERIIACAIDEFSQHGYEMASISRLVSAAGIAKGSFYQYFEDKEDLYGYVIDTAIVARKRGISASEGKKLEEINFTQFIRGLFSRMTEEFLGRPELLRISTDFARHLHDPVRRRIAGKYKTLKYNYFSEFIEYEKKRGELDANVDTAILGIMMTGLSYHLSDYISEKGHEAFTMDYIADMTEKAIYILENGIYGGTGGRGGE